MYKIRVGISACLLGQEVRFDGATSVPASASGISVPTLTITPSVPKWPLAWGARAAIRLVKRHGEIRAEASNGSFDVTDQLIAFSEQKARQLDFISGYILCAKSPAAAWAGADLWCQQRGSAKEGIGLFAKALMEANPLLPVEEDGRLCDPILRENFVLRVFAYHDWQQLCARGITASALIRFHSRYKYLVLSPPPTTGRSASCSATWPRPTCSRWPTATSRG